MEKVAVSVIMPSLNVVQYIEKCMTSVLEQTLKNIEIICIDAGSTDGTYEILEKFRDKDDRVRLYRYDYKSYGAQVNFGLNVSNGKYIAILETDDYIAPEMYKKLFDAAEENNCDFVKCNYFTFWTQKDGTPFIQKRYNLWDPSLYEKLIINPNPKDVCINDLYLWDGIYSKKFLQESGIVFSETEGAAFQDVSFLFQTSILCKRIMYLNDAYYYYCLDREGSSSNSDKGFFYSFREYNFVYAIHKEKIICDADVARAFYCRLALAMYNSVNDVMRIYGRSAKPYYDWFCNEIKWAINNNIITDKDTNFDTSLNSLIIPYEEYTEKQRNRRNPIIETVGEAGENSVVIFGCGNFGIAAYRWFKGLGYSISFFIDNDERKWTQNIDGVLICKPDSIDSSDEGVRYIIANSLHWDEMKRQLLNLGVKENNICIF